MQTTYSEELNSLKKEFKIGPNLERKNFASDFCFSWESKLQRDFKPQEFEQWHNKRYFSLIMLCHRDTMYRCAGLFSQSFTQELFGCFQFLVIRTKPTLTAYISVQVIE